MIESDVIIVGGGPAGSTCTWKLKQLGINATILDKQQFPRTKLCAGWLTPKVIKDLKIDISSYPYSFTSYKKLNVHIHGHRISLKTTQYAIKRDEFDAWLLHRLNIPLLHHNVKEIQKENDYFIIDQEFRCRILVGAGGTNCPVYHTFFKNDSSRPKEKSIITLESEFPYDIHDHNCYLWFYDNKLPGYSWYVPKNNTLNIGLGGKLSVLKSRRETIKEHWDYFLDKLEKLSLIENVNIQPKGYQYYLRQKNINAQKGNVFIIGDAAGLATLDMGEGIGPAVESGIRAAYAIATGGKLSLKSIRRYSLFQIIFSKV